MSIPLEDPIDPEQSPREAAPDWNEAGALHIGGETHVLIVGVSKYRHLQDGSEPSGHETFGLKQIDCAASGAFQFACWVRDTYWNPRAPIGSIRLLLSPSDYEVASDEGLRAVAQRVPHATWANVKQATEEWRDACKENPDNVALFYASGHGICEGELVHAVLLEDFAAQARSMNTTLDIDDVYEGMMVCRGSTQFYFIDACQVEPEQLRRYRTLGSGAFFVERTDEREARASAPIYKSAVRGTTAHGDAGTGTMFSRALIRCLEGLAAERRGDLYKITVTQMIEALPYAVSEEGKKTGRVQSLQPTGLTRQAEIHTLSHAPVVRLILSLEPDSAAPQIRGSIDDANGDSFRKDIFASGGVYQDDVEMGLYNARAEPIGPVSSLRGRTRLFAANPPWGADETIDVRANG